MDVVDVLVLAADDWKLWRRLRRQALADAPAAFGSTLAEWSGEGDTEQRWRARLTSAGLNLVLLVGIESVGMVSALEVDADGEVELISLWVAPAGRRRGVGDEAVRRVVSWATDRRAARAVGLSVKADNEPARRLYERLGFQDIGVSPQDPSERRMRRQLSRSAGVSPPATVPA